jgi:hypothetical protein
VADLDKLLIGNKLDENDKKEINNKLENFIIKKKIRVIKFRIKEHLKFILFSFSLILVILSLSTYYLLFIYGQSTPNNLNNQQQYLQDQKDILNSNKDTKSNEKSNLINNRFYNESNNKENKRENIAIATYFESASNLNYENLKEEVNKCKNNISCVVNLAVKNKNPSLCLFLGEEKGECLTEYYKLMNSNEKYKTIAEKLIKGEIKIEDLKYYNITLKQLIYETGDIRLCKFMSNKEEISVCST